MLSSRVLINIRGCMNLLTLPLRSWQCMLLCLLLVCEFELLRHLQVHLTRLR